MSDDPAKARDLKLLDAVDALPRRSMDGPVWRVVREGRNPLLGARSRSRWCNESFDVLYMSSDRDSAVAEIHSLLNSQPVFPSKIRFFAHRIALRAAALLRFQAIADLVPLGIDEAGYRERDYTQTQKIADAAYFLGFEGIVAPSARWNGHTIAVFTDRLDPAEIRIEHSEPEPIDWRDWKRRQTRND